MRSLAIIGIVCLVAQPAAALNCEQVRYYVDTYGAALVLAYAKKAGATAQQIREGRACLRRAAKDDPADNIVRASAHVVVER